MPQDQRPGRPNLPSGKPPAPKQRGLMPVALAFLGLLLFVLWQTNSGKAEPISWDAMLLDIREGKVDSLVKGRTTLIATVKDERHQDRRFSADYPYGKPPEGTENERLDAAIAAAQAKGHDITTKGVPPPSIWSGLLPQLVILLLVILALYFLVFRRMGSGGGVLSFGKSRAMLISKGKTSRSFKDVAGIDEAKEEVEELVEFLREPRKFQRLGGRIPKGVLLVGPPGTGKTLLARAIAGEADVPFYSISGSDFVEMFVGVGASRVRDLFVQAKDNSPCIIFIDEIDAVARRRGGGYSSGGHDEREQTLNAILVEMDGFSSNEKVIVIAATNRVDVLDPALLRPGRFDRHIHVDLPDITGREEILQVHSGKVKLGPDVELATVARGTPGFSGADLENLINESALHAARHNQSCIHQLDLEYARDRVAFGREKKRGSKAVPEEERRMTAFHEAGHAIIQQLLPEVDDLHKVTIVPRRGMGGATFSLPDDRRSIGRRKMLGMICVAMGGRAAERRFCDDITAGARQDIAQATDLARKMVLEYGMSEKLGPMRYTTDVQGLAGPEQSIDVSESTRHEIDREVRQLLDSQEERAEGILGQHHDVMVKLSDALLEHETLTAIQVQILLEGGQIEPRTPTTMLQKQQVDAADDVADNATIDATRLGDAGAGGFEPSPA
ncbi:MAG: ATP-dependent zinc metalloprotease FtsH [Planctomycetota bacterium]